MSKPLGFIERVANAAGHVYRYQLTQLPRRKLLLKECWQRELKPPTFEDLPVIKKEFQEMIKAISSKSYMQCTVMDAFVRTCVAVEIVCWFFLGEVIGRRSLDGYIVPATYVDKKTAKLAKHHKDRMYDIAPEV